MLYIGNSQEKQMSNQSLRLGVRVTPELRDRVEAYRQHKATLVPGVKLTLSDAARMLIIRGLEAEEGGTHGQG